MRIRRSANLAWRLMACSSLLLVARTLAVVQETTAATSADGSKLAPPPPIPFHKPEVQPVAEDDGVMSITAAGGPVDLDGPSQALVKPTKTATGAVNTVATTAQQVPGAAPKGPSNGKGNGPPPAIPYGPPKLTPEEHKAKAQTLAKDMNATLAASGGKCEGVDKFADFLATQGKEYKHGDEITNHCANFARARQYMTDFPAKRPNAPYQVGLNNFSDWSPEVQKDLRGLKAPPPVDTTTAVDMTTIDEKYFNTMLPRVPYETETIPEAELNGSATAIEESIAEDGLSWDDPTVPELPSVRRRRRLQTLPKVVDYRYKNSNPYGIVAVTQVKNQGNCGSCYAFTAAALVESQVALTYGSNYTRNLSPQQVVDCDSSNSGCSGGSVADALMYVKQTTGLRTLTSYAYTGKENPQCAGSNGAYMSTTGVTNIMPCDAKQLMTALYYQGPVSVYVKSNCPSFMSYAGGVLDDDCIDLTKTSANCAAQVDHAVLLVGYGTDSNTGLNYWVIRNSWGTSWGENGYARLKRGAEEGACEAFCLASYPIQPKQVYRVGTTPPADPTEQGSGNAAQKVLKTIAARVPITETQAIAAGAGAGSVIFLCFLCVLIKCCCCKRKPNN